MRKPGGAPSRRLQGWRPAGIGNAANAFSWRSEDLTAQLPDTMTRLIIGNDIDLIPAVVLD
jgi:hypothetical protein